MVPSLPHRKWKTWGWALRQILQNNELQAYRGSKCPMFLFFWSGLNGQGAQLRIVESSLYSSTQMTTIQSWSCSSTSSYGWCLVFEQLVMQHNCFISQILIKKISSHMTSWHATWNSWKLIAWFCPVSSQSRFIDSLIIMSFRGDPKAWRCHVYCASCYTSCPVDLRALKVPGRACRNLVPVVLNKMTLLSEAAKPAGSQLILSHLSHINLAGNRGEPCAPRCNGCYWVILGNCFKTVSSSQSDPNPTVLRSSLGFCGWLGHWPWSTLSSQGQRPGFHLDADATDVTWCNLRSKFFKADNVRHLPKRLCHISAPRVLAVWVKGFRAVCCQQCWELASLALRAEESSLAAKGTPSCFIFLRFLNQCKR